MNHILENKGFHIRGYWIPPFKLAPGKLVRIYIPNFSKSGEPLGLDLALELADVFMRKKLIPELHISHSILYARNYRQNFLNLNVFPLTIRKYSHSKAGASYSQADTILSDLKIDPNKKLSWIGWDERKMATIKALFIWNEAVSFDYYGMSPQSTDRINYIIKQEIDKGKSAIGFDNLQYMEESEPYEGFERIIVEYLNS